MQLVGNIVPNAKFLNPKNLLDQVDIKDGFVVVDFGAGSGDFSIALAKKVGSSGKVNSIDIRETSLGSVRSKAKLSGLLNIFLKKADLEKNQSSGLKDASQDAVLMANILFHITGRFEVLQEAFRILKSDGILIFADWKTDVSLAQKKELRISEEETIKLIESAGFNFRKKLDAGRFHMGMLFSKS